ncbi:hypothetical protein AALP_AA4G125100 [Arabis alpina]|uniref:MADS-box domain-containing protein n=1 Tax=Arabis alpina TaxID=50452 RepID=A0A087H2U1_ARAAL|nr:hypothetical protein AALP_AA4G125100 [Arabis alpina]
MAPRENKPSDDLEKKRKRSSYFKQRYPGFKKKATELSVLCGNSVGFICYGPDNDSLHVWPENPQTLDKLVAKFDVQSDLKRKRHGCDLNDFPHFEGLSVEELMTHLSHLNSHLLGVQNKKLQILTKTIKASSKDHRPRVGEIGVGTDAEKLESEDHVKVSDTKLGFGGAFEDLGYVVRGSTTSLDATVSDFQPRDDVESQLYPIPEHNASVGMETQDYSGILDPLALGFAGDDSQLYPDPFTFPMGIWDMDLSSTLADSFMTTTTCQTPITDDWGNLQAFQTQPFLWEPLS